VKKAPANHEPIAADVVPIEGMRLGRIVKITDGRGVMVDFPGNSLGPVAARTTATSHEKIVNGGDPTGREALLAFENNDPRCPIIIDTMFSLIDEIAESPTSISETEEPRELIVDGKRVCLEADSEIVLKCGKASITLTSAGKVIIRGEYVVTHSSGENRIRGGSVSIN
jgi:hypothetical protein